MTAHWAACAFPLKLEGCSSCASRVPGHRCFSLENNCCVSVQTEVAREGVVLHRAGCWNELQNHHGPCTKASHAKSSQAKVPWLDESSDAIQHHVCEGTLRLPVQAQLWKHLLTVISGLRNGNASTRTGVSHAPGRGELQHQQINVTVICIITDGLHCSALSAKHVSNQGGEPGSEPCKRQSILG